MNKTAQAVHEPACEIRFSQVGLTQVRIRTTDADALHEELAARLKAAPQLFERSGVCVDFGALEAAPDTEKARALVQAVRWAGMLPVGVLKGADEIEALSRSLDLPLLTASRAASKPPAAPVNVKTEPIAVPAAPTPASEPHSPTLVQQQLVRSGQRVYARARDLIVTATVGAGAEVMSDGCVHVYGSLRGRALAGARGDVSARVFALEFNAELVSIAGVFRVFETLPPELAGKPVQAWLQGDDLHFAPLGD